MSHFTRRSVLAGGIAAGAALPLFKDTGAQAAAPVSGKQVPGVYRYKVGDFEVTVLSDGGLTVPLADAFVRNASKDQVNAALDAAFMEKDKLSFVFHPVVINTGSKLIAIDTGNGLAALEQSKGAIGQYQSNLVAAGLSAGAIDAVVISHFHSDHINGLLTADGKPIFTNAEILVPAPEWAFWTDDGNLSRTPEAQKSAFANARRVFGALANRVTQYEPGKEVVPGIQAVATFGHTPGHTSHIVASGNQSVVVQGDVANHQVLFVRNPGWQASFDMDGAMAEASRRKLYDRLAADRVMVHGYHFSLPAAGHVEKDGGGYRLTQMAWKPVL